jgi:hypothetical protein
MQVKFWCSFYYFVAVRRMFQIKGNGKISASRQKGDNSFSSNNSHTNIPVAVRQHASWPAICWVFHQRLPPRLNPLAGSYIFYENSVSILVP